MNPLKRNSSRSPDGSNQRKISRVLPMDTDRQRSPSISTNQVNANADPRLLRGSRGNALVQSPISTEGSAYQDAASNRTTPQPQTTVIAAVSRTNDEGDAFKKQLLESLVALTTHITADASIRSSHELARRRLDSATAEHLNMKDHFRKYPAIEERLSDEKDKAAKEVAKLEKQLELSGGSQSKAVALLCGTIWDLFSKVAASSRPEPQRDAVTREEYDELQARFQKQQDLLDEQQDRIREMRKTAKEASETSKQARDHAKTASGDISALQSRIGKVESTEQTGKRILSDLVGMVSRQKDDILQLRNGIAQNKAELAAAKEDTLTRFESANSSEDLGKVERQLVAVRNDVNQIWKEITEPSKDSVIKRLKAHDQIIKKLCESVDSSDSSQKAPEQRVKPAEESLGSLLQEMSKVKENTNEPARLELAEQQIESLTQELGELTKEARLKESSDAAAIIPAPVAPPNNFNPAAFKREVVDDIEEQTATLAELLDEHDGHIEKLKEELGSLANKVDKLELERDSEIRKRDSLGQENNTRHHTIDAKYDSIQSEVTTFKTTTDTLRAEIKSLSAAVRSLRDRPAQPQSPHSMNGITVQQFRPVPVRSPQPLTPRTSISGPVQTIGIHPPNGAILPPQMTNGTLAAPSNGEIAVTPDQIQGIWAAVHSLQHRYDNLTTEEIVRAMVDQQSKMYPAPKEFQAAVNMLQNVDHAIDAKLTSLETKLGSLEAKIGSLAPNSAIHILRNEFKNYATENNTHMNGRIQQLQNDAAAARDAMTQLRNETNTTISEAQKLFDHAVDCQTNAINDLRSKVNALADTAFE